MVGHPVKYSCSSGFPFEEGREEGPEEETKMIKGLKGKLQEGRLRQPGRFSLEKR